MGAVRTPLTVEVTGGVNERRLLNFWGGDITKEALTPPPRCDIPEQTAGASASMGKQHYGSRGESAGKTRHNLSLVLSGASPPR